MTRSLALLLVSACLLGSALLAQAQTAYTLDGDGVGANFGWSVAPVGDLNGDGVSDFVVGEPQAQLMGVTRGSARVHSGNDGALLYQFWGDGIDDAFGCYVAGAGDVNADGVPDIVVGAYRDDNSGLTSGSARVFSGATGAILYTFDGADPGDHFGYCVAGAGDVNGDGFADVIVGAFLDDDNGLQSGGIYVHSGADGSLLHDIAGETVDDQFGISVRGAGDVNGDGYDDFIVGAYRDDDSGLDAGSATVFSGLTGAVIWKFLGAAADDQFGFSVSGAGDVNGDGRADLVVGARLNDTNGTNAGMARVFSGLDGSIIWTFYGDGPGDLFGAAVAGAGDLNGDGHDDLIVGARFDDPNGTDSGSARVFSGLDGTILATLDGDSTGDFFGYEVAGLGDLNGDGFGDIAVGAPRDDDGGANAGSLRVITMPTLPALEYATETVLPHFLDLDWIPDSNDPFSVTGTLLCTGATPAGLGLAAASLGSADQVYFGFLPVLIDATAPNLLLTESFGFDINGQAPVPNVSRQNPALAGLRVYLQFFETWPIVASSTAIRLEATN